MTAGPSLPGGVAGPGGPGGPGRPGGQGELGQPNGPQTSDQAGGTGGPGAAGGLSPADELAAPGWQAQGRRVVVVALLAAALIAWAAAPVSGGRAGTKLALIAAVICALASTGRLAIGEDVIQHSPFDPLHLRLLASVADALRALPWAEGLIIAVLTLEALHAARPWHTGLLGAALLAYLIAAHLTQARSTSAALAGQLPVIAAGAGLLVLAVGAAALPVPHAGPATELLRILAVLAAVAAGGLALPVSNRRPPDHDR